MKNLRDSLHINDSLFQRLDAGEKSLIQILCLTVPSSAIVSAIVIFFSIKLLINVTFLALIGGAFIGYILYIHDGTLLSQSGTGRAYARLFLSMVLAVVMAVPLKISIVGSDLADIVKQEIRLANLEVDKELMAEKQKVYDEEKEANNRITEAGKRFADTKNSQELVEARRAKESFQQQKEERIEELEKSYAALKKSEDVTKLDLAAYYFTNMFSPRNPKELFINLSVFILLLLVEALPAIVRLRLEDGEYLSKINHEAAMQKKTDLQVENLEKEILDIDDLSNLQEKVEKIRLWKELDAASKNGFSDTDRLVELANVYARKSKQEESSIFSPPPPPSENGTPKPTDEFADFDYK